MFSLIIIPEPPAGARVEADAYRRPYRIEQSRTLASGEPLIRVRRDHGRHGFTCSAWYCDWNRPYAGQRTGA
jgi:hypothetical protein